MSGLTMVYDSSKNTKNVIIVGRGYVYQGFMDYINSRIGHNIKVTSVSDNMPKKVYNMETAIVDNIYKIDENNNVVVGDKNVLNFENTFLICAMGSNEKVSQWKKRLNDLLYMKPTTIAINGAGPIGTELAFALRDRQWSVHLYDLFTPYVSLPIRVKNCIKNRLKEQKIELYDNTPIKGKYDQNFQAFNVPRNDLISSWHQNNDLTTTFNNGRINSNIFIAGDCVSYGNSVFRSSHVPMRTTQSAYDQGKYIAKQIMYGTNEPYIPKKKFRTMYVGNGMNIVYYDNLNVYILIPQSLVSLYYKLKQSPY